MPFHSRSTPAFGGVPSGNIRYPLNAPPPRPLPNWGDPSEVPPIPPPGFTPIYSRSPGNLGIGVPPSITQTGWQQNYTDPRLVAGGGGSTRGDAGTLSSSLQPQQAQQDQQRQAQQRQAQLQDLIQRSLSGSMGGVGSSGPFGAPAGDEAGARAAAFARAKDQAGKIARASLTGLRESLAGRGLLGGGVEGAGTGAILSGAETQLDDFTREQLIQDLARSRQIADRDIEVNLTRSGQDIARRSQDQNYQLALLGLMQRGQGLY